MIEPARSSESAASTSALPRSHGASDFGSDRVGSHTFSGHRLSEGTLDTSGVEGEDGFGSGRQQVRGGIERHIEEKAVCNIYEKCVRRQRAHKEGLCRTSLGTVGTETIDNRDQYRNKLHEEIGKCCERAIGAITMNSVCEADLSLRTTIFLKDLASADVDHTKIIYTKACCMLRLVRYCRESTSASAFSWPLLRLGQASLC